MPEGRILIIEDEPHIRETIQIALETDGYEAETAVDGVEGLARFGTGESWDLVLLDQRMPGMDGTEVLRSIRERTRAVPVVLITAYGSVGLTQDALAHGARAFLTKPISAGELRRVVREIVQGGRQ
jgi:CheY-like chemotaxis protein